MKFHEFHEFFMKFHEFHEFFSGYHGTYSTSNLHVLQLDIHEKLSLLVADEAPTTRSSR